MENYIGKYVGPNKILSINVLDLKTSAGSAVMEIQYEGGKKDLYPEKGFAAVVSSEPKDMNHLRDARVALMVPEIIGVIEEYDIPYEQFTYLMTMVAQQWQNHFNRANAILWFGEEKEYVPGSDTTDRLTLLMAKKVNNARG